MKLKSIFVLGVICFVVQFMNGQEKQKFFYTKGDDNISTITIGSTNCTVVEYPDFLVLHETPHMSVDKGAANP